MSPGTTFIACVYPILKMAAIVVAGFVLCRRRILSPGATDALSRAVVYVALPCLILAKLGKQPSLAAFPGWYWLPVCAWVTMLIAGAFAWAASLGWDRERLMERRVLINMCAIHNAGYIPIPIVYALWPNNDYMLALVMIYIMGAAPVLWSVGPAVLSGNLRELSWRKVLNPPLITMIGCIIILLLGVPGRIQHFTVGDQRVLDLILGPFDMVGTATIPLILLVLGGDLAGLSRRSAAGRAEEQTETSEPDAPPAVRWRFQATLTVVKLLVMPVVGMLLFPRLGLPSAVTAIVLIECLSPTALGLFVQAKLYASARTVETVGRGLMVTYAASVLTMPVFLVVFHMHFSRYFASA